MTASDQEIFQWFLKEETKEKAFLMLVSKYKEKLYWHIRRMVDNHEDTDDVLQDVFVKLWQKLHQFKGNASLYTFIYRVATNEVYDFFKKKNRKAEWTLVTNEGDYEQELVSPEYVDGDEIIDKLNAALNTLPEKQKMVFNMRYYDEMSYGQIAEILDTSVGALKASYHHAVKKIEKFIKGY